jgi:hypothetical protein
MNCFSNAQVAVVEIPRLCTRSSEVLHQRAASGHTLGHPGEGLDAWGCPVPKDADRVRATGFLQWGQEKCLAQVPTRMPSTGQLFAWRRRSEPECT